jgi:hypothetical protein
MQCNSLLDIWLDYCDLTLKAQPSSGWACVSLLPLLTACYGIHLALTIELP